MSDKSNSGEQPNEDDVSRLTDRSNVIGLDVTEYPEESYQYSGTYDIEYLQDLLQIVEILGWSKIIIGSISSSDHDDEGRLLLLTPDCAKPWTSKQASVALCGLVGTDYGMENEQ